MKEKAVAIQHLLKKFYSIKEDRQRIKKLRERALSVTSLLFCGEVGRTIHFFICVGANELERRGWVRLGGVLHIASLPQRRFSGILLSCTLKFSSTNSRLSIFLNRTELVVNI